MKGTPCQDAPEAWVGDSWDLRQEAIKDCMGCWRLDACRKDAEADPPTHGVWAGVDYTKNRGKVGRPRKPKNCANCGEEFFKGKLSSKQWAARVYCSKSCAHTSFNRVVAAARGAA